jgi:molybdate transport system substrate-binding protein
MKTTFLSLHRRTIGTVVLLQVLSVFSACEAPSSRTHTLYVFAASSLTEAFQELEQSFEAGHPEVDVVLVFGGSHILRHQIEAGAKADIFASAHLDHTEALRKAGLLTAPQVFAHSDLVVVVPTGDPSSVKDFAGLTRARRIVIGSESVPAGRYARRMLEQSEAVMGARFARAVRAGIVSEESNVRLVRAKVEMADADAAIVYRSDVMDSQDLEIIEVPDEIRTRASFSIGAVTHATDYPALWINWVVSRHGLETLQTHGFGAAP